MTNSGTTPIEVTDGEGNPYYVTDELPKYLYLTDDQVKDLVDENGNPANYDSENNTITWQPSTTIIPAGDKCVLSFEAMVKAADNEAMTDLKNGDKITNTVNYKTVSNTADVVYQAPKLTIEKKPDKEEVYDGDTITYTITNIFI